ncbi:MAG TPA: hypothetical protein VHC22_26825 [Pirellulales bacterium]|nr:hypothetical protein [Pirellulales bacterium]
MMRTASALVVISYFVCRVALGQDVRIAGEPRATEPHKKADVHISPSREMLGLLGVAERLEQAQDGDDFPSEGGELLWRMLYSMRRFSLLDIDRWKRTELTPRAVVDSPAQFRGEIVSWNGEVNRVTVHEPPAETAELFNLPRYYRCELEVGEGRQAAIAYALAVPKEWKLGTPLTARVGVTGLFVQCAGSGPDSRPVVVARRIAWYPATPLGDLEMDAGLFDEVSSRPGVSAEDRECFYQLMAAVGRVGTKQLLRAVAQDDRNAKVEPLFNKPLTQRGRLVELTGTAKQAVLRRVEDRDVIARFGIDHFYEMEIFTDDSQGNPLTFCVRELPRGFPEGVRIMEPVRIAGFFFKKWGYRSGETTDADQPNVVRKQLAPLLIGREPVWIEPEPIDQRFANGIFLLLFVVLTAVLWLVVSRLSRSDDKFHRQVAERFVSPQEPLSNLHRNEIDAGVSEDSTAANSGEQRGSLQNLAADSASAEVLRQIAAHSVTDQNRRREKQ